MSLSLQRSYLTDIKGAHSKAGNLRLTSHLREDKKRGGVGREGGDGLCKKEPEEVLIGSGGRPRVSSNCLGTK